MLVIEVKWEDEDMLSEPMSLYADVIVPIVT